MLPSILTYLESALDPDFFHGPIENFPKPPYTEIPDRGDFLLGCYSVLQASRLATLDYNHYLRAIHPQDDDHLRAVTRFCANELFGARRTFVKWPWYPGNPFDE
jgi:hypothetical protein